MPSLMHLDGHWLAFDGDRVSHLDARPKLDRASVVITDFGGAVSQVIALEGSPSHAVALIEKRLRADGLTDSESKILIHQTKTVGNGYQALFTAVPLDRWQQMFSWAEGHDDHCLLVPSVALLWRMLKPGRGIVLHSGRQVVFLACLRNRFLHASALAYSEDEGDLAMTVAALAERAGRELAGADEALETLTVEWYGALTRAPDGGRTRPQAHAFVQPAHRASVDDDITQRIDDTPSAAFDGLDRDDDSMTFDGQFDPVEGSVIAAPEPAPVAAPQPAPQHFSADNSVVPAIAAGRWLDEALLEIFSARSGASVHLGPHVMVRDAAGVRYRSGIGRLAASASALAAVNPPASRLMYLAERALPWASAASLLLALALGGLGGRWALAAHDANGRAEALDAQIAGIDAGIGALKSKQAMPDAYPQTRLFIEHAGTLQQALDPGAVLQVVRVAAADDVRILRLRLDKPVRDPASKDKAGNVQTLRVDGMVNHAPGSTEGMQVARFVQRLRDAGYEPVAVDPQQGNARSQSPGGSFSYQLKRAAGASGDAS